MLVYIYFHVDQFFHVHIIIININYIIFYYRKFGFAEAMHMEEAKIPNNRWFMWKDI